MRFIWVCVVMMWPVSAMAEMGSLSGGNTFTSSRAAVIKPPTATANPASSLFQGNAKGTYFEPFPVRMPPARSSRSMTGNAAVDRIRNIIGRAESPRAGYDAVQYGARIKPRKPPTQMTVGEIMDWIAATPGQPHAIGRYQFIPPTLRRVVAKVGAKRSDRFSPALQDQLADVLLRDAGIVAFQSGALHPHKFMDNLAAIWAGLPTSTGKSRYHGVAGNKATITLADFRAEIAKISPG